jgi:hypothetical protein
MGRHTKHNLLLDIDIRKPNRARETLNNNKTLIMKISTSIERLISMLIGELTRIELSVICKGIFDDWHNA